MRQVALDELQPHDESGAVITGEPNSTIRVQSAPKQRIKSADRVPAKPTPAGSSKARSRSAKIVPPGKAAAARSPSLVRQVVA